MKKIFLAICLIFSLFSTLETFAGLSLSPLKFEFELQSGTTKKEKIKVTNTGDEVITIYSSKQDFISGDDRGTPKFVDPKEQINSNLVLSNWIKVENNNLTLAPKETKEVVFDITVPNNAEPGGHYAAIFFSPGAVQGGQIAVLQRIGVLILVNVAGEVKIEGNLNNFIVGERNEKEVIKKDIFSNFPIVFQTTFENGGNVHLKPKGKIELIDENGEILKNVGKEILSTQNGTYLGEKMVDYIPVNDQDGNVLPKSVRKFENVWEGFGYNVLNEDGTKGVKFKNLSQYYQDKAVENAQFLMFWEKINTRTTTKEITAKYELYYEGKDKVRKDFNGEEKFKVTYEEQYIGINYYLLIILILLIGVGAYYFIIIYPKQKLIKEQKLREKILNELNQNNN